MQGVHYALCTMHYARSVQGLCNVSNTRFTAVDADSFVSRIRKWQ